MPKAALPRPFHERKPAFSLAMLRIRSLLRHADTASMLTQAPLIGAGGYSPKEILS
jgi:hypothetical protein